MDAHRCPERIGFVYEARRHSVEKRITPRRSLPLGGDHCYPTSVLAVVTLSALGFTWRQLLDLRQAERIHQLVEERRLFDSPEYVNIRQALAAQRLDAAGKLQPLNPSDPPPEMYDILDYFEELGILQKRGFLDAQDIWDEFGYWALNYYSDAKPLIESEQREDPTSYRHFDELNRILVAIDRDNNPKAANSSKDIEGFYQYEKRRRSHAPHSAAFK